MAVLSEYTWIFALAVVFAFFAAFGIGANDLANSFGSSVGTKALRMWQAVLIAAVCEFSGALLLGAGVTDTIKSGIANPQSFAATPAVFMYGFFAVIIAAAFWDNMACQLELPVSTTHTTVGATIGFALAAEGGSAVIWSASKSTFPYFKGVAAIFTSWVVSPLAAFVFVAIVFGLLRALVLRRKNCFQITFWLMPLFTGVVLGTIAGFIIQTGGKNGTWDDLSDVTVLWISVCCAVGSALFTLVFFMPFLKKTAIRDEAALQARIAALQAAKDASDGTVKGDDLKGSEGSDVVGDDAVAVDMHADKAAAGAVPPPAANARHHGTTAGVDPEVLRKAMMDVDMANASGEDWTDKVAAKYHAWVRESKVGQAIFKNRVSKALAHSLFYDVHTVVAQDETVAAVWAHAEVFDYKTERMFRYLQVFSAAAMSFAHGSNDVANAMGPLSAVYYTWINGKVPPKQVEVQFWILALGGVGISVGLATFGYKIMRVLGVKAVKLTNVRGFVCEWVTTLIVVIASRYGLPISSTQVITGAIMSMGLMEGAKGLNWRLTFKVFGGWVLTLFVACGVSAAITAFGVYSPNKSADQDAYTSTNTINSQTYAQIQQLNSTSASNEVAGWNSTLTSLWKPTRNVVGTANLQAEVFSSFNSTVCTVSS